jgi:hypothetical protein
VDPRPDRRDDLLAAGVERVGTGRVWRVPAEASFVGAAALASALLDLVSDGAAGVRHVFHDACVLEGVRELVSAAGLDPGLVEPGPEPGVRLTSRWLPPVAGWRADLMLRVLRVPCRASRPSAAS